ncbi:A/G-specific adenine glycosylase [Hespellia stercorisuis]|uniref:Sugar fermentation stimulation protein homolog n=1 Tax=Hespellia stercorisuis DSM 15480 TaxID=1121950 RepID=A0A1M6JKI8_9FIRM|nr:A/G-specific adenine glycosylase [Hespellia stercorisuis]SHJ47184.1 A/G-specific DNA-adenine glycosylase [Hespellia stercorisuis DSM 15480]
MNYERIKKAKFIERPNRFIARVEIEGVQETVHVKNTGRCAELLRPGAEVFVQESDNPERKTKWDLIAVKKEGRMINMDSQVPNKVVKEWIEAGNLFPGASLIRPETTYGNSRFDLYVEVQGRKIFIEVKGVTLEEEGVVRFPDAPSERAVKHVEELAQAVKAGYEAYVFFVVQMRGVRYLTPNMDTHPAFGEALRRAKETGVHVIAYDCDVTKDSISIRENVPVVLYSPVLKEAVEPLVKWYRANRRQLPWRENVTPYRVWVSEIMLQQTRVEAVKPYYERFLKTLPTVQDLAAAKEDTLLKLWEGLGYYNRIRNMQKAAQQIVYDYNGEFPESYEAIHSLTGIGNYTAGAIGSFAFGIPKPAVDGNVMRVFSRLTASYEDIMKASARSMAEKAIEEVIPEDAVSDFNQGLIELGALVCVPNGEAKCGICPLAHICRARAEGLVGELPIKKKAKDRRIEKRTVLIFKDGESVAIHKRPAEGLLAGLYELPNELGEMTRKEVIEYSRTIGLAPIRVKKLPAAKHIFSHIEWQMTGYVVQVDELEKNCRESMIFASPAEVEKEYSIPSAFSKYMQYLNIEVGADRAGRKG